MWLSRSTEIRPCSWLLTLLGCPGANNRRKLPHEPPPLYRRNCISGEGGRRILKSAEIQEDAMRKLSELVSEGFIWSVGITRPKPGKERIAAIYITTVLCATILGAVSVFAFLLSHL